MIFCTTFAICIYANPYIQICICRSAYVIFVTVMHINALPGGTGVRLRYPHLVVRHIRAPQYDIRHLSCYPRPPCDIQSHDIGTPTRGIIAQMCDIRATLCDICNLLCDIFALYYTTSAICNMHKQIAYALCDPPAAYGMCLQGRRYRYTTQIDRAHYNNIIFYEVENRSAIFADRSIAISKGRFPFLQAAL